MIPDSIMTGLELRRGTADLIVNDPDPDIVHQLEQDPHLRTERSAGADFQYIGTNLRDPILKDVRVRRALSYADRPRGHRRVSASRARRSGHWTAAPRIVGV